MTMRARWALLLAALLVAAPACVIHLDGHGPDQLDDAIRDAGAEVNLHHALMTGAQTMEAVRAEVARHTAAMDDRVRELQRRMNDWYCVDYGGMDALEHMLDELEDREHAYQTDMAALTSVVAAHEACGDYGDDMDELLGRMMNRWMSMDCEYGW